MRTPDEILRDIIQDLENGVYRIEDISPDLEKVIETVNKVKKTLKRNVLVLTYVDDAVEHHVEVPVGDISRYPKKVQREILWNKMGDLSRVFMEEI